MTQFQLDHAIAVTTGESICTIRNLGFGLLAQEPHDLEPEDLRLVLDCPFCRQPVPYPDATQTGDPALAECDHCDVYFDFAPSDVYAAAVHDSEVLAAHAA